MKVLFLMAHAGYSRNFESTIRLLAEEGHTVVVAFDRRKEGAGGADDVIRALTRTYAGITDIDAPVRTKRDPLTLTATQLRATIDYLRYLEPRFRDAHKLRRRAAVQVPAAMRAFANLSVVRSRLGLTVLSAILRSVERAIPPRAEVRRFIREQRPDLVLLTPLLEVGSPQVEYVRAAHDLGIRTALCVASWDNLTTAGLIHEVPGLVTVWNEYQKEEAVELHDIPPANVAVTGACAYDHWFEWSPSTSRQEFCAQCGIRADRPFILYTCSSGFITPGEDDFIVRWVAQLRADPALRDVGLVIRPHPTNSLDGKDAGGSLTDRLAVFDNVAIWPRSAVNPTTRAARSVYYDSVFHSAAVVGINTSAFIESAILGRRVYTVLAPEYRDTQEGTPHFHHLLSVNGGLLNVAPTFDEHTRQLAGALEGLPESRESLRPFLEGFVRPFGLDEPATPRMVQAFEELRARRGPTPWREAPHWVVTRPVLSALASRVSVLRAPTRSQRAAAGAERVGRVQRRRPLRAIGRWLLQALLGWGPLRRLLYRHVRPLLLSAAVEIERAARPGRSPSRPLQTALELAAAPAAKIKAKTKVKAARDRPKKSRTVVVAGQDEDTRAAFAPLAEGTGVLIAGPWLGDVGSEVLRWIPFLRWATEEWPELSKRLVAVSRGGVAGWYEGICSRYIDASELFAVPPRFVERAALDGLGVDPMGAEFEVTLTERLRQALGAPEAALLSPNELPRLERVLGMLPTGLPRAASYAPPTPASSRRPHGAPADYVAARFAVSRVFPATAEARELATRTLASLLERSPVVLLADDFSIADDFGGHDGLVVLGGLQEGVGILGTQAQAIAHSKALVGSYDGMTIAAAVHGVPAAGVYVRPHELDERALGIARTLFQDERWPAFAAVEADDAEQAIAAVLAPHARAGAPARPEDPPLPRRPANAGRV